METEKPDPLLMYSIDSKVVEALLEYARAEAEYSRARDEVLERYRVESRNTERLTYIVTLINLILIIIILIKI